MELEFDKEIDAILRKASHSGAVSSSAHLDADVISAFAENALPQRARSQYTVHVADCDRCRKLLSQTISMSDEAEEPVAAGALPVSAGKVSTPWYEAIFRTPNMAIAMGGLILVFTGVLGFLVLQNSRNSGNTLVSQAGGEQAASTQFPQQQANFSSNSNAAIAVPAEQMPAANLMAASPNSSAGTTANPSTGTNASQTLSKSVADASTAPAEEKSVSARQITGLPKAAVAPPPPPPSAGVTLDGLDATDATRPDTETEKARRSDSSLAARTKETDDKRSRDLPPGAATSGTARSGPAQSQNIQNSRNAVQMSVTRSSSGRKFNNRDGAWYDTAYKGQATTNVRRGTVEFKKLDSGLRAIANEIDGVVVVVWNGKPYRIQ
jgi:hypothetical protein